MAPDASGIIMFDPKVRWFYVALASQASRVPAVQALLTAAAVVAAAASAAAAVGGNASYSRQLGIAVYLSACMLQHI
jgi:hypothetical protein